MIKLDYSDTEPVESADGMTIKVGESEITLDEEWCSDQLYNLLVQKCEGPALEIIMNQNLKVKARGLIAWYRTLREAEGQVSAKRSEITEKVYQSNRKAVAVKDVVATLEAYENEVREYRILTGNQVEDSIMLINLKKMVPENIRERLETVDIQSYAVGKEYALKQVRNLKKTSKTITLDFNDDEEEEEVEERPKRKTRFQEEAPEEDDGDQLLAWLQKGQDKDDLLAWLAKGSGKGKKGGPNSKGGKGKDGKGGFQGTCHYCGIYGHRINECHKKDADMKGKGKGQEGMPPPGWNPFKGKGKGNKGAWSPGTGAWGKGGKGAYGLEDDWSEGFSGYSLLLRRHRSPIPLTRMEGPKPPQDIQSDSRVTPVRGQSSVRRELLHQNQHRQVLRIQRRSRLLRPRYPHDGSGGGRRPPRTSQ